MLPTGDQAAGADQLAQEVEVDEDVVEHVASVHEGSVGDEAFGDEPGERQLGPFGDQGTEAAEARAHHRLPAGLPERLLVGVDDDVPGALVPLGQQGLPDGQGRAAVREADLDHDPSVFRDEHVSEDVAVLVRDGNTFEVTLGPETERAGAR